MNARPDDAVRKALEAAGRGEPKAAEELLPLVYEELRKLARARLGRLAPGQTLQTTALVHEAWLKVVGADDPGWERKGHFFAAAARSMKEILVDRARRRATAKRGGDRRRVDTDQLVVAIDAPSDDLLALDEALGRLEADHPRPHQLVLLRFFAGLSAEEAAEVMNVSMRTAERDWMFARAWLHAALAEIPEAEA